MMENEKIPFGNYIWRVLERKEGSTLIITEDIIELRWYHKAFVAVTWADCELRTYLNNAFYNQFNQDEKARIIAVKNNNPDNPWFRTNGGAATTDRIFLLSLEEVCAHFGDSSKNLLNKGSQKWLIDDEHNEKRQAKFDNAHHGWRLRSPGYYSRTASGINAAGQVYVRGNGVYGSPRDGGGVRPALWLKPED